MKSIEITTSHNIVVSVELANSIQRFLATLTDISIISIYFILASVASRGNEVLFYLLTTPVYFYSLLMEVFNNGQSIGKKALKLRVVALDGQKPSVNDLVMRWMFRIVDVWFTLGALGMLFISSTNKNQRIGDILANTSVVKLNNENIVELKTIKKIGAYKKDIKYPQIVQFNDKDMLLVKQAIGRFKLARTEDNRRIIWELSNRISDDLELKKQPENRIAFLQNVLEEYIVLTR